METFCGLSSTAWTGLYTILTAGLLVVAALAAVYASRQWRVAREQAEDSRRAALEAARPYVIVDVRPSAASPQLFDLVICNIGRRPAFEVVVKLDPPPERASERGSRVPLRDIKMLNEPIAMIAPDQELRTFWDNRIERQGRDDLTATHDVAVTYADSSLHVYGPEHSVLDLNAVDGAMFVNVQTVHTIGKTLDKMLDVFTGASILGADGHATVEAVTGPRADHAAREAREAKQRDVDNLEQLLWLEQYMADDERKHERVEGLEAALAEASARLSEGDAKPKPPTFVQATCKRWVSLQRRLRATWSRRTSLEAPHQDSGA